MVHQHRLGDATALEGLLQLLTDKVAVQLAGGGQRYQVAAMVVEYRQRPDGVGPVLGSLEVHLPQFVGPLALEALDRLRMPVSLAHQVVAQKDAVDGAAGQRHALLAQQELQLASSPVRVLQAQRDDLLSSCSHGVCAGELRGRRLRSAMPPRPDSA